MPKKKKSEGGFLKSVAKIFAIELLKIWLPYLFGFVSLGLLFLYMKEWLLGLLTTPLLMLPPTFQVYHLLLVLFLVASLLYFPPKIKKLFKHKNYYFIEEGGAKWYVIKSNGDVSASPLCPIHQITLNRQIYYGDRMTGVLANFYCDICEKDIIEDITQEEFDELYHRVERKAEAKAQGHAKGF